MNIKIDVIPSAKDVHSEQIIGKTVVVIDVLRASTTIVSALMHSCSEVIPADTIEQAKQLKGNTSVLAGERFCERIDGFEYTNSPIDVCDRSLRGKQLVLTTTNGTVAIQKAKLGESVFIGSFLNGPAVAKMALKQQRDITLLCAGTRNQYALEDTLCAGYIISHLQFQHAMHYSDLAWLAYTAYQHVKDDIPLILPKTTTGNRLVQRGLTADIQFCAQKNITNIVPYLKDNRIIVHPCS